ncbi:glutathione S-transferase [Thiosulfatimonas sediminis]|uniref:Glutathione S-transferase n=1 Tax=Thiosulfatimonas sediminis TaxID=2675054 RepID=A0A6F8PXC9_9GAMM|nr:glutathione S-transferase [Thiosulfatimonas sediminis]BBP46812.1 glutathione S-transferase [Thiosulfatimonas sediminis]
MTNQVFPILYSYRRCPYAMRARLAIWFAQRQVEQREIVFWDKPESMLQVSPKATVPVLVLPDGEVIEESWEIMQWALMDDALFPQDARIADWIAVCDGDFKMHLDAYKYPELCQQSYPDLMSGQCHEKARQGGEVFLQKLENQLQQSAYLLGNQLSIVDLALFPFVRQFSHVDKAWWNSADYPAVQAWLAMHLASEYFAAVMKNRPVWQVGHQPILVNEPELQRKDQFRAKVEGKAIPR